MCSQKRKADDTLEESLWRLESGYISLSCTLDAFSSFPPLSLGSWLNSVSLMYLKIPCPPFSCPPRIPSQAAATLQTPPSIDISSKRNDINDSDWQRIRRSPLMFRGLLCLANSCRYISRWISPFLAFLSISFDFLHHRSHHVSHLTCRSNFFQSTQGMIDSVPD